MALLMMEGFETFGTTVGAGGATDVQNGMQRKYSDLKGVSSTAHNLADTELDAGRSAGFSLKSTVSSARTFSFSLGTGNTPTDNEWVVGFAVKFSSFPTSGNPIVTIGRNTGNAKITVTSTGTLRLEGLFSNLIEETASPVLSLNTWHFIEWKTRVADAPNGDYEIRVDGQIVLSATGVDTDGFDDGVSEIVQFTFQRSGQQFDDMYVCDQDGPDFNDFLGRVVIEAVFPNAEGDAADWTPQSGTDNSAMVDDNPADDDATYVETNTQDAQDLYQYTDLSTITAEPILAVQVNTDVKITLSPGDLDVQFPVKSGTTTDDGSVVNVASDTYQTIGRILTQDPDTAAAWTQSGIDAAQFGIKAGT
ncbi:MAG: hypothetical protein DWQ31_16940 [Planctomycetota bacterium]|nr:MAG: hypothetical protein DWQ31_16940 [Planctomycetota bacterium]REJ92041.1 MAG: hypothetical protein DWQ35_12890 [Planctomycetota bacterium]REK28577.1 MAG: hypothetical protein DWQ42_04480 [Planctomycetota bacterium]REK39192.1 MAG: hypothetical protein DWQ46_18065 [Planctomycetota bacterium]